MKNHQLERFRHQMREYHRHNPWWLRDGLYVPHSYEEPRVLSWWGDVGFILNARRVLVLWVHPRLKYAEAISEMAWAEAGDAPQLGGGITENAETNWKQVGRSRKKVVSYRIAPLSEARQAYFDAHTAAETRLRSEGINLTLRPSVIIKRLAWCTSMELCLPLEVRTLDEVRDLAALARRLLKRETTVEQEFPGYAYGRAEWLGEAGPRVQDLE